MESSDIWGYRDTAWSDTEVTGFSVEALDGSIGKIDKASNDVGAGYIVVDTGPWIFGKKVLLPAGIIDTVDVDEETVYVQRTKDEIKNAPEFDEDSVEEPEYRDQFGAYYGSGGSGYFEDDREYSRARGSGSDDVI